MQACLSMQGWCSRSHTLSGGPCCENVVSKKKEFYRYISSKRKIVENDDTLLNGDGALMSKNIKKDKVLMVFFCFDLNW